MTNKPTDPIAERGLCESHAWKLHVKALDCVGWRKRGPDASVAEPLGTCDRARQSKAHSEEHRYSSWCINWRQSPVAEQTSGNNSCTGSVERGSASASSKADEPPRAISPAPLPPAKQEAAGEGTLRTRCQWCGRVSEVMSAMPTLKELKESHEMMAGGQRAAQSPEPSAAGTRNSIVDEIAAFVEVTTPYLQGIGSVGVSMAQHIRKTWGNVPTPTRPPVSPVVGTMLSALKHVQSVVNNSDAPWWMDCPSKGGIDMEIVNASVVMAENVAPVSLVSPASPVETEAIKRCIEICTGWTKHATIADERGNFDESIPARATIELATLWAKAEGK